MNTDFSIQNLCIEGVRCITPFYMEDTRGFFLKNYEKSIFQSFGIQGQPDEEFETLSKKGVIRGLHFQTKEPQNKLVRVIKGRIRDIVIDLRKGSKTFGKYLDIMLTGDNRQMLWIPAGFAHGFEVLSEEALVSYKCFGRYLKDYDTGIRWNDGDLAIKWLILHPTISPKDASLMSFHEFIEKYVGL